MKKTEGSESATAAGCPSETELAGKADICEGCPGQALCKQQGGRDPDQDILDTRMKAIKHKILILSGKGGVGKSSVAACLSMALAELSHKVGVVDLDICGPSIPKLLAVEGREVINSQWGWKPLISPHHDVKVMSVGSLLEQSDNAVIWRGPRKTALIRRFLKDTFWGRLDVLICDTPPGTSDEHLTVVKAMKSTNPDGAVIVTTPQEVAIATIRKELNFCRKMGVPVIGIVENMSGYVCPCCQERTNIFSSGAGERLAREYSVPFLGRIPIDQHLVQCCEEGSSIFKSHPESPAASALLQVAQAVMGEVTR
ncbi:cytosolic Fe-S cluster assembly factor NUBP2-like [Branchiostoma floridae]|uniref:Cytosolic Fe-S cluster assembly factor NUBP2-like n=1 Tax=Branchiostoma floridae TaxID=7739 RepID=A0A9J7L7L8_BRAFL|nr:cytosolic Fe-S cluster assembly factor NUBP2-like [Branchiostoma floridae]